MPAYNAEKTIEKTYHDLPKDLISEIILVDDASGDQTIKKAKSLRITVYSHPKNKGYGANQKTCYKEALKKGADIIIMLHPDYQYLKARFAAIEQAICHFFDQKEVERIAALYEKEMTERILKAEGHT